MNPNVVYLLCFGMFISVLILFFDGFRGLNRYLAAFLLLPCFFSFLKYNFLFSDQIAVQAFFSGGFWSLHYYTSPMAYFYLSGMLLQTTFKQIRYA